jgi:antitoxin ParD1/3/4
MATAEKRTISLIEEQAAFIDRKVAAGAYASTSDVVDAGLRALRERDEAIESWLVEQVAPAYDAIAADPSLGRPVKEVFGELRSRLSVQEREAG